MLIKLVCTECGTAFRREHSFSKGTKVPFCSSKCYGKWQRGKSFKDQNKPVRKKNFCSLDGCNNIHFGKGFCRKHYLQFVYNRRSRALKSLPEFVCEYCGSVFKSEKRSYGRTPRFCSFKCMGLFNRKPFIIKKGYKKILNPLHPRSDGKGYVFEHIIVAEKMLKRPIKKTEEIHHRDKNKLNNREGNLHICSSHSEHMKLHLRPSYSIE